MTNRCQEIWSACNHRMEMVSPNHIFKYRLEKAILQLFLWLFDLLYPQRTRAKKDKHLFMANSSEVVTTFIHFCFNSFSVFYNEFQFVVIEDDIRWNIVVNINAVKQIFCTYLNHHIVCIYQFQRLDFLSVLTIYLLIHMYTKQKHVHSVAAFGYIICFPLSVMNCPLFEYAE